MATLDWDPAPEADSLGAPVADALTVRSPDEVRAPVTETEAEPEAVKLSTALRVPAAERVRSLDPVGVAVPLGGPDVVGPPESDARWDTLPLGVCDPKGDPVAVVVRLAPADPLTVVDSVAAPLGLAVSEPRALVDAVRVPALVSDAEPDPDPVAVADSVL